jgi:hypothetical protein
MHMAAYISAMAFNDNLLNYETYIAFVLLTNLFTFRTEIYDIIKESRISAVVTLLNKKVPHFSGYLLNDSLIDETFFNNNGPDERMMVGITKTWQILSI